MALKRMMLSLAERQIGVLLIANLTKSDVATARMVREVRSRLELKRAGKTIEKLTERSQEFGLLPLSWDDMLDPGEFLADLEGRIEAEEAEQEREKLEKFRGAIEKHVIEESYALDDSYLRFLQDLCEEKDWSKAKMRLPNGSMKEIEVPVSPAQLVAFANFADKINAAIVASSILEEREKEKQAGR